MNKLTIVSQDETTAGLQILTEDGVDLSRFMAIEDLRITFKAGNFNRAHITVAMVQPRIPCGAVEWLTKNPRTGDFAPVQSITFRDGSILSFDESGVPAVTIGSEHVAISTWRSHKFPPDQTP